MDEKKQLAPFETAMGPAMASLANDRQRAFVDALFHVAPGHGAMAAAARMAGYEQSTPHVLTATANRLMRDPKVQAAIAEETKRRLRASGPQAVVTIQDIMGDPLHKDRLKAAVQVLDRLDPVTQRLEAHHVHEVVDRETELFEAFKAAKEFGASQEKLIELFGFSKVPMLERKLAEQKRREPIDVPFVDVTPEPERDVDADILGE
jgi:phage terminase small subunit